MAAHLIQQDDFDFLAKAKPLGVNKKSAQVSLTVCVYCQKYFTFRHFSPLDDSPQLTTIRLKASLRAPFRALITGKCSQLAII